MTSISVQVETMKSIKLALRHTTESHSSLNLKKIIENILKEFHIFDKTFATTSDTARNIVHCLRDLMSDKLIYKPCYCHVINLIANDVLHGESEILQINTQCRKLVGCFQHSNLLSD